MEIKKYYNKYVETEHSPEKFFNWISRGRTMEIRFLSDAKGEKFCNWELIKVLAKQFNLEYRFNSLFVNKYEQIKAILVYKLNNICLTKVYNIFISINPKRKVKVKFKNGLIGDSYYGGIAGTSYIQNFLCDIEHTGERRGNATEEMLDECVQGAEHLVQILELKDYAINISGNGVHLWATLDKPIEVVIPSFVELPDSLKYNLKEPEIYTQIKHYNHFIESLNDILQKFNEKLKVDEGAKDFSRIARFPGSWNVKTNKTPRAVGTIKVGCGVNNITERMINSTKLLSKEKKEYVKKKELTKRYRYTAETLHNAPIYQLLISKLLPSTYSRNHYLEQSFARLLRDNDISPYHIGDLIEKMDLVQQKNVQIDPDYLDGDESFNPETVNSYCVNSKVDLVYPLLDDIPVITEGFINDEQYNIWNEYSIISVRCQRLEKYDNYKPKDYLELKEFIRKMIDDGNERVNVFFTCKYMYKLDWDFYNKNKVILQIMNKTRKMVRKDE